MVRRRCTTTSWLEAYPHAIIPPGTPGIFDTLVAPAEPGYAGGFLADDPALREGLEEWDGYLYIAVDGVDYADGVVSAAGSLGALRLGEVI